MSNLEQHTIEPAGSSVVASNPIGSPRNFVLACIGLLSGKTGKPVKPLRGDQRIVANHRDKGTLGLEQTPIYSLNKPFVGPVFQQQHAHIECLCELFQHALCFALTAVVHDHQPGIRRMLQNACQAGPRLDWPVPDRNNYVDKVVHHRPAVQ